MWEDDTAKNMLLKMLNPTVHLIEQKRTTGKTVSVNGDGVFFLFEGRSSIVFSEKTIHTKCWWHASSCISHFPSSHIEQPFRPNDDDSRVVCHFPKNDMRDHTEVHHRSQSIVQEKKPFLPKGAKIS